MKKIFKYTLEITDYQEIKMPFDAKIISVENQNDNVVIYVEVDADIKTSIPRAFEIIGTGNSYYDKPRNFLGTVVTNNGRLVWHVFESFGVNETLGYRTIN